MATTYQYPRCLDESHIRVLHIKSAEDQQLVCSLKEMPFDKNDPGLENIFALSYCWGADAATESILIDEQHFWIRPNLLEALSSLLSYAQTEGPEARFWVDAVCINQNDNKEKAAQLDLMSDIYGKMRVLVWLGPPANGSTEVLSILHALDLLRNYHRMEEVSYSNQDIETMETVYPLMVRHIESLPGITAENVGALERFMESDLELPDEDISATFPAPDHPLWRWFLYLFLRPWFYRVWTLQEVELQQTKDPQIFSGPIWCGWGILRRFLSKMTSSRLIANETLREICGSIEQTERFNSTNSYYRIRFTSPNVSTLRNILVFVQARKATNPKDYVYGYLGFIPLESRRHMIKNYDDSEWSVAEVFTQAVGLCCQECGRGDEEIAQVFWPMLMEAKYSKALQTNHLADLPSWCPDFGSERVFDYPLRLHVVPLLPSLLQSSRQMPVTVRGGELTISGFHVDCVRSCTGSAITRTEWATWGKDPDGMVKAIRQWLKELSCMFDHATERQWLHNYYGDDESMSLARITEDLDAMMQLLDSLEQRSKEEIVLHQPKYSCLYKSLIPPIRKNQDQFFFSTANGKVGSSLGALAPGDFACYFPGSRHYTILSPSHRGVKHSSSQRYRYVGLAEIPDYMGDWLINQPHEDWTFHQFTIV